jgi:CRISPR-associated protein Cst1
MSEGTIYKFTGNPFVDAGIWALGQWIGKEPEELNEEDLKIAAEDIFDMVYSNDKWYRSIIHGMVFPNGKFSNPGDFKKPLNERKKKAMEHFNGLIGEITPLGDRGSCIACGRRNIKRRFFKSEIPLTGSGKMLNYFSFASDGADYCSTCAFAVQFSPLLMYKCGDLLLLHSDSRSLMKIWSKRIIHELKSEKLSGCFDEGYKNVKNAFFHIIGFVIDEMEIRGLSHGGTSITFYHFKNFNQGANLDIYYFPVNVYNFLTDISKHENYDDWLRIVRKGYRHVNWEKVKEEGDYKNNPNLVYNNLLEGKSIIGFFIDRKNKEAIGGWDLLSNYLEEVRNMDEKRINAIKEVADKLAEYIETADDMKTLKKLETATNYRNYRNILRIIVKKRIENAIPDPLFTFDNYVNYLFPEGNLTWRETQDLILFRIYEKLQPWIIKQGKQDEILTSSEIEEKMEEEE